MKKKTKVSVLVPAHNEEELLLETIKSILSVDYDKHDYEVIVVDDGSTDNTYNIVSSLAKRYNNLKVFKKQNGGRASALNEGLRHASGKFILITDADTLVDESWISEMESSLEHFDVVQGACYGVETKYFLERVQKASSLLSFKYSRKRYRAVGANFGFSREVFEKAGFFDENTVHPTSYFLSSAKKAGFSIHFNPLSIVYTQYTYNLINFLKQKLRWREEALRTTRRNPSKLTFLRLIYSNLLSFFAFFCVLLIPFRPFLAISGIIGVFLIDILVQLNPLCKMLVSDDKKYVPYVLYGHLVKLIIRITYLPYVAYRVLNPRKNPAFEAKR